MFVLIVVLIVLAVVIEEYRHDIRQWIGLEPPAPSAPPAPPSPAPQPATTASASAPAPADDNDEALRRRRQQQPQQQQQQQAGDTGAQVPSFNPDQCPICLEELRLTVTTNCGHSFCDSCVVALCQHEGLLQALRCPVCRQTVTLLLGQAGTTEATEAVHRFNRRFGSERQSLWQRLRDMPTLLRHLWNDLASFNVGIIFYLRVIVFAVMGLAYLVLPVDLLPDVVPIIGQIDDLLIGGVILTVMVQAYRENVVNRGAREA
eukprot:m.64149 g.64149  ORF g.64149 m.64149 type:complete len:261 (+) comp13906_c3_seq1:109-891(+)